jgi:hypothetical protein
MSDENILKSIDSKLDMLTKLMALDVVKGRTFNEQVKMLHFIGMSPAEIASCIGKTPNNVRVAIHGLKKKSQIKGEVNE